MSDNTERPITYASRALTQAEKNYSQLEKKSPAIILGVKYHQPLSHLPSEKRETSTPALSHILRWDLTLGAYDYTIK